MGTPRPHLSRHVSGRAPRRGRRPRRPVFCSPIAGCTRVLHLCLRWPYFFQQRKKYEKERRQKPTVFGFPFRPIVTAVQKGSAPNRLHSYPRCRSCVPCENFLLSRRTGEVLYILHTFIFCGPKGRTYTCRRRRQVRDLIIVLNGRPASPPAHHVSGSEGKPVADSLRDLFPLHRNRPEGNPKTIGFWRRSFSYFFRC